MTKTTSETYLPLDSFQERAGINWKQLDDADKRTLVHWLKAREPEFFQQLQLLVDAFDGDVTGIVVPADFWSWLKELRAWQRDRDAGVVRPRPEVPEAA